jgi:hypothetical protein
VWSKSSGCALDNSEPVSIIRRLRGIISVVRRNCIVGGESDLTRAPITPREVRRKYSKGRDLEVVLRKGYRNKGMCAVSGSTLRRGYL